MNAPAMLVLRPGDKVLVALTEDPGTEACAEIAKTLNASFPRVEFTILTGVAGLAVSSP